MATITSKRRQIKEFFIVFLVKADFFFHEAFLAHFPRRISLAKKKKLKAVMVLIPS